MPRVTALRVVVVAFAVLNQLKATPSFVADYVWPYWQITYAHGFIRRGLVGSVFQALAGGLDAHAQRSLVLALHCAAVAALDVGLAAWAWSAGRRLRGRAGALFELGVAAFFLSAFLPTLLWLAGYVDVYVVGIAMLGAWLASTGRRTTAAAVASLGPFVHEAFVFLWVPVVVLLGSRAGRKAVTPLLAPFVIEAFVLAAHSDAAALRAASAVPGSELFKGTFELTVRAELAYTLASLLAHGPNVLLSIALFLLAAAIVAVAAAALGSSRRSAILVASILPCTAALVAWDLSRFLLWGTAGAFLALVDASSAHPGSSTAEAPPVPRLRAILAVVTAVLVALSTGPFVYAYIDLAEASYAIGPASFLRGPVASLSMSYVLFTKESASLRSYAAFRRCDVIVRDAHREPGACVFSLGPGGSVETPPQVVGPDRYVVTVRTSPLEACDKGRAIVEVRTPWRLETPREPVIVDGSAPATTIVPITVSREDAAMARLQVRVSSRAGCVRVDDVRIGIDLRR